MDCCGGERGRTRMHGPTFPSAAPPLSRASPFARWRRRVGGAAGWMVPGVVLAIVPKCPMCVVAYVGAATGLGLSYTAASMARGVLIWACVAVLIWLGARSGLRAWTGRR